MDVEFRSQEESFIDPPNPDYVRVHAAFAKVVRVSQAAYQVQSVMWHNGYEGDLDPNEAEDVDFAKDLWSKLVIL